MAVCIPHSATIHSGASEERPDEIQQLCTLHPAPVPCKVLHDAGDLVFNCAEESLFFSSCLERMLPRPSAGTFSRVVEFGSGDGVPVIACLRRSSFNGQIDGYELSAKACDLATHLIQKHQVGSRYVVHNSCFFRAAARTKAHMLISNPPYLPAPDSAILMPQLHGGVDGSGVTRRLLTLGFSSAALLISAYSNPVATIHHAQRQEYRVADFMITTLPFGRYSSEPKVKHWLAHLKRQGVAFFGESSYLLAGVLFTKDAGVDLADQLLSALTSTAGL